MNKFIDNIKSAFKRKALSILNIPFKYQKNSYSQLGEDLIVSNLLRTLGIKNITYLEIGANHPYSLSNTYLLYKQGGKGVLIEPDPVLYNELVKKRKKDIILNVGVGVGGTSVAEFFVMSASVLNTFSREEAEKVDAMGTYHIKQVLRLPLVLVSDVIKKYFDGCPAFISLDVEGWDELILKDIEWDIYRPAVICVETLEYAEGRNGEKLFSIIEFMISKGYMVYADTYINTIFVDSLLWNRRHY